jgi:hypothetical protein
VCLQLVRGPHAARRFIRVDDVLPFPAVFKGGCPSGRWRSSASQPRSRVPQDPHRPINTRRARWAHSLAAAGRLDGREHRLTSAGSTRGMYGYRDQPISSRRPTRSLMIWFRGHISAVGRVRTAAASRNTAGTVSARRQVDGRRRRAAGRAQPSMRERADRDAASARPSYARFPEKSLVLRNQIPMFPVFQARLG